MQKNYEAIFNLRGSAYDLAMKYFPFARIEEFMQVISAAAIHSGMVVADVPAGGGYLKNFLPNDVVCYEHEACDAFHGGAANANAITSLVPFPWENASIDVLISLAGLHHQQDKTAFFKEAFRVTKPKGKMIVSDVMEKSDVALFLDDFIGNHNSTGHEGIYLNANTEKEIQAAGWVVENVSKNDFAWKFDSTKSMILFCKKLFDLPNTSDEVVLEAIHQYLGMMDCPDGSIGMHWQLLTITASK